MSGAAPVAVELVLRGRVGSAAVVDWICHRAARLDLAGGVEIVAPDRVVVRVQGPRALVEAMEVACLLGPSEALVTRIDCRPWRPSVQPDGFQPRTRA